MGYKTPKINIVDEKSSEEKIKELRKTFPLKLDIFGTQNQIIIDDLIKNYKECINIAIDLIYNKIYPLLTCVNCGKPLSECNCIKPKYRKGFCPLCRLKGKELKFKIKDFKIGSYQKGKDTFSCVTYLPGKSIDEICDCIKKAGTAHFKLRKFVLPSSNYNVHPSFDFTTLPNKNGQMPGQMLTVFPLIPGQGKRDNIFDSCLQKAVETIQSQTEINKKIQKNINFLNNQIKDKEDYLNKKLNNKIKRERELLKRFSKENTKKIEFWLEKDKKRLKRELHKIAPKIEYKKDTIRLYEQAYEIYQDKLTNNYKIKLRDYSTGKDIILNFCGINQKRGDKKLTDYLINNLKCETEIVKLYEKKPKKFKQQKGTTIPGYYLHYIYKQESKVPSALIAVCKSCGNKKTLNEVKKCKCYNKKCKAKGEMVLERKAGFIPVGIDLGLVNTAVLAMVDENKIKKILFYKVTDSQGIYYSGRHIRRIRQQFLKYRRIISKRFTSKLKEWRKKQGKDFDKNPTTYKWTIYKNILKREENRMDSFMKKAAKDIAIRIKDWEDKYKVKTVVIFENLLGLREDFNSEQKIEVTNAFIRKTKGNQRRFFKKYKRMIEDINKWKYDKLKSHIIDKLNWLGIPHITLSKELTKNTSNKCNKCNKFGERGYNLIKCNFCNTLFQLSLNQNFKTLKCPNCNKIDTLKKLKSFYRIFYCPSCDYIADADFNAGVNIARAWYKI